MKISKKIAGAALISGGTLLGTPSFSQNTQKLLHSTSSELIDVITHTKMDSIYTNYLDDLSVDWLQTHCDKKQFNEIISSHILEGTNSVRKEFGVGPLSIDLNLMNAAQKYAQEMSATKHYSHISVQGKRPIDRAMDIGYPVLWVGENIGLNFESINDALLRWKESKPHFENIVDPSFTDIGIACVDNYRVVMFGANKNQHKK